MAASNPGTSPASNSADREILVTRLFDAPRELVFEAWTNLKHIPHWWGPKGFATTVHEMDVRPGGVWRLTMRGPDGRDYKNRIVFVEVAKPERLVYKHEPEPGSEPVSFQTTVTFVERGDQTEVTVRMLFPSAQARDHVVKTYGAIEGLNQTLGRLAEHLEEMVLRRERTMVRRRGNSSSPAPSTRPGGWSLRPGASPKTWRTGGGRRASRCPNVKSIFGPAGSFTLSCAGPTARTIRFAARIWKSLSPSASCFKASFTMSPAIRSGPRSHLPKRTARPGSPCSKPIRSNPTPPAAPRKAGSKPWTASPILWPRRNQSAFPKNRARLEQD